MKRALAIAVLGLVAELSAFTGSARAQSFCVWSSPRCTECAEGAAPRWRSETRWEREARWASIRDEAYHEIFGDGPRWSGRRKRKGGGKAKPAAGAAAAPVPAAGDAAAPPAPAGDAAAAPAVDAAGPSPAPEAAK